jgi:hypothetical protein
VTPVRRLAIVLIAEATQVEQPRPVLVHVHPPVQSTSVYAGPNLPVNRTEHARANRLVVTFRTYRSGTGVRRRDRELGVSRARSERATA